MGDLQVPSPPVNGAVSGEDFLCLSRRSPASKPDPSSIGPEAWSRAEKMTHEMLCSIQPTLGADRRRREVVDYVQRLSKYGVGCEVCPYGSVPLKTYLPDGDIDLTVLSCPNFEDTLVSDVHALLRGEEITETAEYEVKDVRFIDAEVKPVKCIVQNIVVDVSFNQLGGLCTLCFLEKVDCFVGKDHLFRRSIILIKAWCYYVSRILGAHHGLISTYALETLVLYIFHQFHLSLDGPLAVLYRFLHHFSKFDWDNYCVSLKGPVGKSSLPDIVAELPENGENALLTEEFIRNCVESFSVPSRGIESNLRAFPLKHMNIIDPLKENNNLGRSVNRGNFYRIRSAFKYGSRKLGWILMLPVDRIAEELKKFFANTWYRHRNTQWDDMQTPTSCSRDFDFSSFSDTKVCSEDNAFVILSNGSHKDGLHGNQHNRESRDEREQYLVKDVPSLAVPLFEHTGERNAVARFELGEGLKKIATSGILGMMESSNGSSHCSNVRTHLTNSASGRDPPHPNLGLLRENGKVEHRISCRETVVNSVIDYEKENIMMIDSLG